MSGALDELQDDIGERFGLVTETRAVDRPGDDAVTLDLERRLARSSASPAEPTRGRGYSARLLRVGVVLADTTAVAVGMLLAAGISRGIHPFDIAGATRTTALVGALSLPLWVSVFFSYRLYDARCVSSRLDEMGRLIHAVLASVLVTAALSFLANQTVSRGWLVLCFPSVLAACWLEREVVRRTFNRLRRSGRSLRPVVLVGANAEAASISELLTTCPSLGYRVVGVVDDGDARDLFGVPVTGRVEDTLDLVRTTGASGVIVATTAVTTASSNRLVRQLIEEGVHVELSSSLQGITAERLTVRPLGTTPVLYIEPVHHGGWQALAKRTFDVVCSSLALLIMAPVLLVVALAIKVDSKGSVFFSQVRVGKDRQPFRVFKFRTMVDNAEELLIDLRALNQVDGPLFKLRDDPRVTRLGRILRRFSIDEIPQLWNVLRGEMSVVGPRPALFAEMDSWAPELQSRLRVRPGLTGMWQVSGRSNLSFADYVRFDLYYVENWSLWRDVAIVAKTFPVVLSNHGAY